MISAIRGAERAISPDRGVDALPAVVVADIASRARDTPPTNVSGAFSSLYEGSAAVGKPRVLACEILQRNNGEGW